VTLSKELSILESCFLRPVIRNSVLEELRVKRYVDNGHPGRSLLQSGLKVDDNWAKLQG